jgi:hypothetical protein
MALMSSADIDRRLRRNPSWPLLCSRFASMNTEDTTLRRDPDEWKTGDEPMTAAQRSYLETLCHDTGETFDDRLTKAEASRMIDELRERSPRLNK